MRTYVRLPLDGTLNTRELGGYPIIGGGVTNHNIFLRSDYLSRLTENDKDFLYDYGIRTILDLRDEGEIREFDAHIMNYGKFAYKNVSLVDDFDDFDNLYITIVTEYSARIRTAFEYIAERLPYGGILFHCMVGKDRTGVTAALLLSLAGAADADIIANYTVSSIYLRPMFAEYMKTNPDIPLNAMESSPAMMASFLKHIKTNYGTAYEYLLSAGVTKTAIDTILSRFVNKNS